MPKKKKRKLSVLPTNIDSSDDNLPKPGPRRIHTDETIAKALLLSGGRISHAADMLGIAQSTVSYRVKKSEYLQTAIFEATERGLDLAESVIMKLIEQHDLKAAKFFLQTKGKHRGYGEQKQVSHEVKGGIVVLPAQKQSSESWEEQAKLNQQKLIESSIETEVIDEE